MDPAPDDRSTMETNQPNSIRIDIGYALIVIGIVLILITIQIFCMLPTIPPSGYPGHDTIVEAALDRHDDIIRAILSAIGAVVSLTLAVICLYRPRGAQP